MFNIFEKDAWYTKWYIWVIGFILIIPFCVMFFVLLIGVLTKTAAKLDVKGKDYYLSPYIWIILLIIPILGWIILSILYLYINIAILVKLHDGNGEKYIS